LLYEATQGPPLEEELPPLNPANNVTSRQPPPSGGLAYKKDSTRPGGGVFVAHGKAKGTFPGVGPGVIIESHSDDDEGEVKSLLLKEDGLTRGADGAPPAGAHDAERGAQTSSGRDGGVIGNVNVNVNPVLNEGGMPECENVHVMNVLDSAPASTRVLEQLALADNNWLDGIPGGMFDWGACLELVIR
jgi:hypothetical protein